MGSRNVCGALIRHSIAHKLTSLSAVAGIAEPEYGAEAIHPVTSSVDGKNPYHEAQPEDFAWKAPSLTNVETQTFYFTDLETGYIGFAQIIHLVVSAVYTTAQFTFRMYNKDSSKVRVWRLTHLEDFQIRGTNFYAKNLSLELVDGLKYVLKLAVSLDPLVPLDLVVDMTVTRLAPAVLVGRDGTTLYGTDVKNPWGLMRHAFWPKNKVTGHVEIEGTKVEFQNAHGMLLHALQGMKPHHAAAAWNFVNWQSEDYAAVQMEFTTPASYAYTKVNIGILVSKDRILSVSVNNKIEHLDASVDTVGWPVPKKIVFHFDGVDSEASDESVADGSAKKVEATLSGDLSNLVERVDVMGEIPGFVKTIAGAVSGTKPFIYQYANELELDVAGSKTSGMAWTEVTFISELKKN